MKIQIEISKKLLVIVFIILLICLGVVFLKKQSFFIKKYIQLTNRPSKVEPDFNFDNQSFEDLKKYFQQLAKAKGARKAFEVLKVAPMPPNIDLHLLGHVVGDELYKQEGAEGIAFCSNDFRNACSHSIVTGLFFDMGDSALQKISEVCQKAPGGTGAYTMCFHGLGHGILAYEGYDMKKGAEMCNKTGTAEKKFRESSECIGGMVMEIIGGGFHDRDKWQKQRVKFLNKQKPLALCQNGFVPENAKYMCYNYLTPFLWESVGANMGNPSSEDFKKSFKLCEFLPKSDLSNRDACFGGFGKEFVGLVQSRDIRKDSINKITDSQLTQVYDWCKLGPIKDAQGACVVHSLNSLYWGGENDVKISIRYCKIMTDEYMGGTCFTNLIAAVSYYTTDKTYRANFCSLLPDPFLDQCKKRFELFQ